MRYFNWFPWYVLFIAIYSPLILLAGNIGEVGLFAANRAVVVMLVGEILFLLLLNKIYDDWQKAGFVAFMLTILAISYGHFYSFLAGVEVAGLTIGRHRYLLIAWTASGILVLYFAAKIKQFSAFEETARFVSIMLVVFAMFRLATFYYLEWQVAQARAQTESTRQAFQAGVSDGASPDVYYIILDAYGRSDVLANDFDVDNSKFLNSLRSMGFFVAECSQSNYAHTHLSLASSLNFSYLEDLGDDYVPENKGWAGLTDLIQNSAVRRFLENRGYKIAAFETGYAWTEWRNADLFVKRAENFFSKNLTSFESLFLHTTIGAVAVDLGLIPESRQNFRHYEMILSNLDAMESLAGEDGPKFVFAHFVIPHHPFVFGSDGKYHPDPSISPAFENYTDEAYYNGYRQQVIFINERILGIVEAILSKSERPPVIVIQGDHGPSHAGQEARVSILNAYYLPDGPVDQLNAGMTPVNTFRVILNAFFDQNLPLLRDTAYFSKNAEPYAYTVIPNECKP